MLFPGFDHFHMLSEMPPLVDAERSKMGILCISFATFLYVEH